MVVKRPDTFRPSSSVAIVVLLLILTEACSDNTAVIPKEFDEADANVALGDSGETPDGAGCLSPPDYPDASEYLCYTEVLGEEWCSKGNAYRCVEPVEGIPVSGFFPSEQFSTTCCGVAHPDVEMTLKSVQVSYENSLDAVFRAVVGLTNHGNQSGEVRSELATIEIDAEELDCSSGGPGLLSVVARPVGEPFVLAAGDSAELELVADFERSDENFPPGFNLECKARGEPFPALTYCYRANCSDGAFVDEGCSTANSIQFLETQVGQLP